MAIVSLGRLWRDVNPALCELLGYQAEALVGAQVDRFVERPETGELDLVGPLLGGAKSSSAEHAFRRSDGGIVWLEVSCSLVRDAAGEPLHLIAQCNDVTEARATAQELAWERHWLAESQAAGHVGSWELELETGVMRWSREQFKLYGVEPSGPTPRLEGLIELIHPDDRAAAVASMHQHMESGEDFVDEYRIEHPELGARVLLVWGRRVQADSVTGAPATLAGTTLDVTAEHEAEAERQRYQAELERLATHDSLTGLANRRTFDGRLALEFSRIKRDGGAVSLAVLDIDNFKQVNDTYGHPVGDAVLARVAETLAAQVRDDELLARVGGEEFAWIIRGTDVAGCEVAVERGRSAVASTHFGDAGRVTISAGISHLAPAMDSAALYRMADQALLAAKRAGRNRVVVARHNGGDGATGSMVA